MEAVLQPVVRLFRDEVVRDKSSGEELPYAIKGDNPTFARISLVHGDEAYPAYYLAQTSFNLEMTRALPSEVMIAVAHTAAFASETRVANGINLNRVFVGDLYKKYYASRLLDSVFRKHPNINHLASFHEDDERTNGFYMYKVVKSSAWGPEEETIFRKHWENLKAAVMELGLNLFNGKDDGELGNDVIDGLVEQTEDYQEGSIESFAVKNYPNMNCAFVFEIPYWLGFAEGNEGRKGLLIDAIHQRFLIPYLRDYELLQASRR